jgi:hypothetical protein
MQWILPLVVVVALGVSTISAEVLAPLDWKPSVLLRASTGDLPTHNLTASLAEEEAKGRSAQQVAETTKAEAGTLLESSEQLNATLGLLRERVETKQAELQSVQLR